MAKLSITKKQYETRQSGRSTRRALRYILDALERRNVQYVIEDHSTLSGSDRHLWKKIQDIVAQLQLKGFKFKEIEGMYLMNYAHQRFMDSTRAPWTHLKAQLNALKEDSQV